LHFQKLDEWKNFREYNWESMKYRSKIHLIWLGLVAAILLIGIAWALLRIGILFSVRIGPPDFAASSSQAWSLAKFAVGVGALAMALIQIIRVLIPIRGYFQRQQLLDWLVRSQGSVVLPERRGYDPMQVAKRAMFEFETRSIGRPEYLRPLHYTRDFYDSSTEQLSAQLNAAIEAGLDIPWEMPDLLSCFFGHEGMRLLEILFEGSVWGARYQQPEQPVDERKLLRKAEARASLSRLAQFRIDTFQIETAGRWRRYLRSIVTFTSLTLSFAVTTGATWHSSRAPNFRGHIASIVFYSMLEGLIAAFVAMFLRDLVAIVETKRRRS
jgi:hypothetical protein